MGSQPRDIRRKAYDRWWRRTIDDPGRSAYRFRTVPALGPGTRCGYREGSSVSLTRKALISVVVATVVLGLLALPGNAAPEKQFSLKFPTTLSAGTQNISVILKNETPNGNSNINSFRITAAGPVTINSISPGSGTLSNGNKTISVNGISTLKPLQSATYTLNITVASVGCAGGTINWTGQAWT